jgi:hypothetical protein
MLGREVRTLLVGMTGEAMRSRGRRGVETGRGRDEQSPNRHGRSFRIQVEVAVEPPCFGCGWLGCTCKGFMQRDTCRGVYATQLTYACRWIQVDKSTRHTMHVDSPPRSLAQMLQSTGSASIPAKTMRIPYGHRERTFRLKPGVSRRISVRLAVK